VNAETPPTLDDRLDAGPLTMVSIGKPERTVDRRWEHRVLLSSHVGGPPVELYVVSDSTELPRMADVLSPMLGDARRAGLGGGFESWAVQLSHPLGISDLWHRRQGHNHVDRYGEPPSAIVDPLHRQHTDRLCESYQAALAGLWTLSTLLGPELLSTYLWKTR
jgi:hypothetical protein